MDSSQVDRQCKYVLELNFTYAPRSGRCALLHAPDTLARVYISKLEASQVDDAAALLARAFFDYPMWTWILPDEEHRRRALPIAMRQSVRWGMLMNECYLAGNPMRGIAIWTPGALSDADLDPDGSRTGYQEMIDALGRESHGRFELLVSTQRPLRARDIPKEAMYLPWLGVDPEAQRTGIGTALLLHMFARTDKAGAAVYLETEKAANVPYYERHGFRVLVSDALPNGGPRFWTMLRQPSRG
jgi:ribosomal protein S18 acetylase RimI-like enzyme